MKFAYGALVGLLMAGTAPAQTGPFQESGGLVIMEMESTDSPLGLWVKINPGDANYVSGATGTGHFEFTGNTINGGPATSPITYTFTITQSGNYHLNLRARKRLEGEPGDKCNDCYVNMAGTFTSGSPHYDDSALRVNTKLYGGNATDWGWATHLDSAAADHVPCIYNFVAGETYTLTISGRSIRYNLDRIVLRHSSVNVTTARDPNQPESPRNNGSWVYEATTDFPDITSGEVPYYVDSARNALAIDAATVAFRDQYARATRTFDGTAGTYDATITALQETDGECHYRFLVNGAIVGTAVNNPTPTDYVPQDHTFPNIAIPAGATIAVESDDVSNNTVPEGGGWAYARGRWTTLTLAASTGVPSQPVANAGPDRTVVLPDNLVTLFGSGTDDVGIVAYQWYQVSGPNTATTSGDTTATVTFSDLVEGPYVFGLAVGDTDRNSDSDEVTVVVLPEGGAFATVTSFTLIDANTDQPVPGHDPILEGEVINTATLGTTALNVRANTVPDSDFGSVTFALSGATTRNITESGHPWALFGDITGDYSVGALNNGAHTLTATPYDQDGGVGNAGASSMVTFTVTDQTDQPVANAGPDQTVELPGSSATLNGSGSDNGSITGYAWTQISGPTTTTLGGQDTATLAASGLVQGTYVFRLTVTDNESNTAFDEAIVSVITPGSGSVQLSGELKRWHKISLTLDGPVATEGGSPNPFADYRMNVTFTHPASGLSYVVPGYFAADGDAANTSATSGNKWRAHLAPDHTGTWNYLISFRSGTDLAINDSPTAGAPLSPYDNTTGSFTVTETDKSGRDFRGKGRLNYVGKHHLQFAGTGEYFLKAGADAPENFLAYNDFDDTPNDPNGNANLRKTWSPHAGDYSAADASAYTWAGGKGTEMLGAIKYLHDKGLNVFSFLPFSLDGDDDNVFPHLLMGTVAQYESVADNARWAHATQGVHHDRFDVSKMAQWEQVFAYGDKKGMYLHFKTMETENELRMDGGNLGRERKLYYRELIARFGHHLALNWNLGEEINNATSAQKRAWAKYFWDHDPYQSHIVIHNGSNHYELMGPDTGSSGSECTGFSLQTNQENFSNVFGSTLNYINRSITAGKPWVVACDEPGDASHALRPAGDEGNSWTDGRKNALWGNIMAGGAGCEFYFGYQHAQSDLNCQDWRSRDGFWDYCRYALEFFEDNNVPFWDMSNHNALTSNANSWCLAKPGEVYVVYLKAGGTTTLDLSGVGGSLPVQWFDPRNGGGLQNGSVTGVAGGSTVSLGNAPGATGSDWVILVGTAGISVQAGPDQTVQFPEGNNQVTVSLNGSVNTAGEPSTSTWSVVQSQGTVAFTDANDPDTTVLLAGNPGIYELQLSVVAGTNTLSDTVIITVNEYTPDTNPPTVVITSPANGAEILIGPDITFAADVTDHVGITRTDFYLNGNLTGSVGSAPYHVVMSRLTEGVHTLTAVGVDTSDNHSQKSVGIAIVTSVTEVVQSFNPVEDVYLENTTVLNNNTLKTQASGPARVGYLKFDVAGLPAGTTVSSAVLTLTENGDPGNGTLRAYRGSHATWTEATITSANAPVTQNELDSRSGSVGPGQSIDLDVTPLVTGNEVVTVIVKMDAGGNDIWFGSSETAQTPVLTVTAGQAADVPPLLNMASVENEGMLTWWPPDAVVESATTLEPPDWQPVPESTSPFVMTFAAPCAFYRIHR